VTESGRPANTVRGVRLLRNDDAVAVYEVDSGTYVFASRLAPGTQARE